MHVLWIILEDILIAILGAGIIVMTFEAEKHGQK